MKSNKCSQRQRLDKIVLEVRHANISLPEKSPNNIGGDNFGILLGNVADRQPRRVLD
jgi:hypothetical protein